MKPEERENFRLAILRALDDNPTRWGLGLSAIAHHMLIYGYHSPTTDDLQAELAYLEDKKLIAEALKGISPENRAWRITAEGRDFIAKLTNE
ncbi:MAG TPA: hypothetical protein PLK78_17060 [Verrucomicrobiota bacterium]|nr:hypothetical protein [Verrucomicrobiota bacterium]